MKNEKDDCHRITLRIPKEMLKKIDVARKKTNIGTINRTFWILEQIARALK